MTHPAVPFQVLFPLPVWPIALSSFGFACLTSTAAETTSVGRNRFDSIRFGSGLFENLSDRFGLLFLPASVGRHSQERGHDSEDSTQPCRTGTSARGRSYFDLAKRCQLDLQRGHNTTIATTNNTTTTTTATTSTTTTTKYQHTTTYNTDDNHLHPFALSSRPELGGGLRAKQRAALGVPSLAVSILGFDKFLYWQLSISVSISAVSKFASLAVSILAVSISGSRA